MERISSWSFLVVFQAAPGGFDISSLAALVAPDEEDDERLVNFAAIDPVSWPEIETKLDDSTTKPFVITPMADAQPSDS